MGKDMTVPCEEGLINLRVGAIIIKNGKILMVGRGAESNFGKLIYEVSYYYFMKVPDDFGPVCMSMTEDDHEENLSFSITD